MGRRDEIYDVAVLGAGPAGVAAAVAASKLGYRTIVVSRLREPTVEGLSARTIVRLRESGLEGAADSTSPPAPRLVHWAGEHFIRGQESLVNRKDFDAALCHALRISSTESINAAVRRFQLENGVWKVETSNGVLSSRTVLDARGRRARRCDKRGPLLVAWNAMCRSRGISFPGSVVVALDDGWCWIARAGDGFMSFQFVGAANEHGFGALDSRLDAVRNAIPEFDPEAARSVEVCTSTARAAVARCSRPSQGVGFLRIGDAAVAMDPLSGNGIHAALGSAHVAVAAVNSYLLGADWPVLARFVDERAAELWRRSVAAAAEFYRRQAEHARSSFWVNAACGYERAMLDAASTEDGPGRFEMRPVLDGVRIELRRVWVSADWPRGVWKVNDRVLSQAPAELVPSILRRAAGASHHEV